jgi:hypothetical protein
MTAPTTDRQTSDDSRHADMDLIDAFSGFSQALSGAETGDIDDAIAERPSDNGVEDAGTSDDASTPERDTPDDGGPVGDAKDATEQAPPEDGADGATDDDALLKDATPLAYTVDGQSRTLEWVTEVPGQGAFVPADKLAQFKDLIQRGEHADGERKRLYQVASEYQALGGRAAYEKLAAEKAMLDAAGGKLLEVLTSANAEQVLLELATNPQARAMLLKEAQLEARDAGWKARTDWTNQQATATRQSNEAQQAQVALNVTIDNVARTVPGLTAEDVATARQYFSNPQMRGSLYRRATVQDQQQYGLTPGELVLVPQAIHQWMQDRATLRSSTATASQKAQAAQRENATRMAAMQTGKPNGKRPTGRPGAGKPTQKTPRKIDEMSFEDIKRGALSGRLFADLGDE